MPLSRPMPVVGPRCHELRVRSAEADWRIVYRADADAVVILAVFRKATRATPTPVIDACIRRLREYDRA
jgi:phage-related protein